MTEKHAELVGYAGHRECLEVRLCTRAAQVWDQGVQYGVGLGLGRLGYWVGTDLEAIFIGREREDVMEYARLNLDGTAVRFVD